jgi:hypothetical protein
MLAPPPLDHLLHAWASACSPSVLHSSASLPTVLSYRRRQEDLTNICQKNVPALNMSAPLLLCISYDSLWNRFFPSFHSMTNSPTISVGHHKRLN